MSLYFIRDLTEIIASFSFIPHRRYISEHDILSRIIVTSSSLYVIVVGWDWRHYFRSDQSQTRFDSMNLVNMDPPLERFSFWSPSLAINDVITSLLLKRANQKRFP